MELGEISLFPSPITILLLVAGDDRTDNGAIANDVRCVDKKAREIFRDAQLILVR